MSMWERLGAIKSSSTQKLFSSTSQYLSNITWLCPLDVQMCAYTLFILVFMVYAPFETLTKSTCIHMPFAVVFFWGYTNTFMIVFCKDDCVCRMHTQSSFILAMSHLFLLQDVCSNLYTTVVAYVLVISHIALIHVNIWMIYTRVHYVICEC